MCEEGFDGVIPSENYSRETNGTTFINDVPQAHLLAFTVKVANGGSITHCAGNVKEASSDRLVALLLQLHEIGRHNGICRSTQEGDSYTAMLVSVRKI